MKEFSNTYIFIFSTVMVLVVAFLLSFAALNLKPMQDKNVEIEKKRNILSSVNIQSDANNAEEIYEKYIKESFVVDFEGNKVENVNAFDLNMKVELKKEEKNRKMSVFVFNDGSKNAFIFPLLGKGLWGPIWGYISLESDLNTVFGVYFSHKGETPGLGAEISTQVFQDQFKNKKIFDSNNEFVSIHVLKSGATFAEEHSVDAISGGTITSKGVEHMLMDNLKHFQNYFKKSKNLNAN